MKRVEDQIAALIVDVSEAHMEQIYHAIERETGYWMELTLSRYEMERLLDHMDEHPDAFTKEFIDLVGPILFNDNVGSVYFEMKEVLDAQI